jgi:hypothetical protein
MFGRVLNKYREFGQRQHSVEFDVLCNIKGPRTEKTITLRDVGYMPGMCESTDMDVGSLYVVFVWSSDNNEPEMRVSKRFDVDNDGEALSVFGYACGITPTYPLGTNQGTCPTAVPPGECYDKEYFEYMERPTLHID